RECLYPASRLPGLPDGLSALCCARAVSGIRSQRGSSPSRECGPSSLASTRTCACGAQAGPARTDPVGGCSWASTSPHLDDPLAQAIRRDPSACRPAAEPFPSPSPTTCGRITVGVGKIGSHAMPGRDHPTSASLLLAFPHSSPATKTGGTDKPRSFFYDGSSPL